MVLKRTSCVPRAYAASPRDTRASTAELSVSKRPRGLCSSRTENWEVEFGRWIASCSWYTDRGFLSARFSISSGCEQESGHGMCRRKFNELPCSKPILKTLFSLRTATRVFEKPLPIRRPESSDTDGHEGNIRRDVAATLKQKRGFAQDTCNLVPQRHSSRKVLCKATNKTY
jgi:hypothetical protein